MYFGTRCRRDDARALAGVVALSLLALARAAAASPIDDPFVAGMSFSGPTSGDLSAIYWNPAALGLMRGFQVMVAGTARWSSIGVQRAPIMMNGAPGGTQQTGSATATDFRQPFQWPPGPGAYAAVGYGSDRFTLAFATYMPYLEKITFPTSTTGNEPTRYQVLSMDLRNLALVPALSIRFGSDFRVGLSAGFLFSTGSLSFAEDTALDGLTGNCDGAALRRREPGGRRALQRQLGPRARRRDVLVHPRRRHLLPSQEPGARPLVSEPTDRQPGDGRRGGGATTRR